MSTANTERGEVEVPIGDKAYVARLSFKALQRVEANCGPIVDVIRRVVGMNLSVSDAAYILHEGIQAAAGPHRAPKLETVGEAVMEMGIPKALQHITDLLTPLVNGTDDEEARDEEKA